MAIPFSFRLFMEVIPAALLAWLWLAFLVLTTGSWRGVAAVFSNAANACALTALLLACQSVFTALRPPFLLKALGQPVLYGLHQRLGPMVLGLVFVHVVVRTALLVSLPEQAAGADPAGFLASLQNWPVNLGRMAAAFILLGGVAAFLGARLQLLTRAQWRPAHFLVYAGLPLAFIHAFVLGYEIKHWSLTVLLAPLGLFAVLLMLKRLWQLAFTQGASVR